MAAENRIEQRAKMANMNSTFRSALVATVAGAAFMSFSSASFAVDADAARQLARQNNCFKCHSISHDKDGPAYKKVSAEYKDNPDAEAKLIHHITSGEQAKFADGHTEAHKVVKTDPSDDMAQIKNLVDWILVQ